MRLPVWLLLAVGFWVSVSQTRAYAQESAGRNEIVWKVQIEGNETYSNLNLRDIIATQRPNAVNKLLRRTEDYRLRETEVRRDVIRIERYYQRRGYDEVSVSYSIEEGRKPWQKIVTFTIREGEPLRVSQVETEFQSSEESEKMIRQSREFDRALQRHEFQPGNRYQIVRHPDVEGMFTRAMEEAGFAYADVEIETKIDSAMKQVAVKIINLPGPRTYIENVEIDGEVTVDKWLIMRETNFRKGSVYSRTNMQQAQRELFNHHLFRFATVNIPDQPQDSTLDLTIRIREFPPRSVEASFGIGREELLRGQLTWLHRNVFHTGNRFSVSGRASFIEQRLGLGYLIPYVFNSKSSFVSNPFAQHRVEPAFELFRAGFSNSLIYQFNRNLTSSVSYEMTINEEVSGRSQESLPDTMLSYNTGSFTVSGYYNQGLTRSDDGWVVQPSLEVSSVFGEGSFEFQKGSIDIRRYTRLSNSLTLANRIQTGAIFYVVQDSLPSNIRFFSGGTNSVRGFNRQMLGPKRASFDEDGEFDGYVPVGGRAVFNFNVELRQRLDFLFNGLGMAAFFDGGQVWRAIEEYNPLRVDHLEGEIDRNRTRSLQFGVGGGISYDSPIGPIRFDLGYKLNPTQADLNRYQGQEYGGMGRWAIHFSIGQAF